MTGGSKPSTRKRPSQRRDEASPMLVDYIRGGPATATEELAAGHKAKKGGKTDREGHMKKKLEEWDQQWREASS